MPGDRLRLLAVVAAQLAILAAIPARQVKARATGLEITLETAPVDPLDPLSGWHVTLHYRAEQLGAPPPAAPGATAWLVLERAAPSWRAVACLAAAPEPAHDRVVIRARVEDGRCRIPSAGRFYIPEARRREVTAALAAARTALVDLRVDEGGGVALVRLRAGSTVVDR